ncbi:MAG TPA: methyltransferase [Chthonomonas sp.]|jgi:protein-S-isoprenylcysteine O-methyltransferase Ste14|uniref:methyltransferase family protein n=1 Tax=Chthonomonas sp. TaxID=2282153 RepID=UPI002B4AE995|nr:methyltransferase [Chthonomonas sp.]HLH79218.1 methyltransferase [Chthonomonas sp.]
MSNFSLRATTARVLHRPPREWGAWIFQRRTWLPLFLLPILAIPFGVETNLILNIPMGVFLIALGETIRFVAVGYAGTITRTRHGRLAPLITSGPYRFVRNPLYVGNLLLFAGLLGLLGRWFWLPILLPLALGYYHLVVLWEEQHLRHVFGSEYDAYTAQVGRWWPRFRNSTPPCIHRFYPTVALRSERGTLGMLVLAVLVCLLYWTILL